MPFLPSTPQEMRELKWDAPDFVLVTGDAYIDHPSFGAAIIGRILEREGFRVALLAQPNWRKKEVFAQYGRPHLGFLVTGGNIDSMVAHYTVAKRRRHDDMYTPGNKTGKRPDRAVTVYGRHIRKTFPDVPIIIGGIEASLRRLAHYDYWDDCVYPSVLIHSEADILVYGMGERAITEIARRLKTGVPISRIHDIDGTVYAQAQNKPLPQEHIRLGSYEKLSKDKGAYVRATKAQFENADCITAKPLVQNCGSLTVVQRPPSLPLTTEELDNIYELPFTYSYPSRYDEYGGVKAMEEIEFSITHNRGCFGGCNFCSIAIHQGRYVVGRSHDSVLKEAEAMTKRKNFKGYINDVGGATANFRFPSCKKQKEKGLCIDKKCLYPNICPKAEVDHSDYLELLAKLRNLPKVKRVFIRSGIRYDYLLADKSRAFLETLVQHHVSGQLRVAPEHTSPAVLKAMGKPPISVYEAFSEAFYRSTKKAGKEQYVLPYLMSSHPGSTIQDAIDLALWLKKNKIRPEQVQDFYPTPGTISTAMYYTGVNPLTMERVYVPKTTHEKEMQRALLQAYKKENEMLVREALKKGKRIDLLTKKNALLPLMKSTKKERKHR